MPFIQVSGSSGTSGGGGVSLPIQISDVTNLQTTLDGKQSAGTYATLVSGTVPSAQLPSYVDDVLEYANAAARPATGEAGKIYVTLDNNKTFRWSGSAYIEISPSPGSTDSVSEGSTNLYFTNVRAAAAAPVQSVAGKTGTVTLAGGDIASGTVAAARLGSGTANSSTFLRGDGQWASPPSGQPTVVSLSYASSLATDASAGSIFDVTLTGNVTLSNPTNPTNGQTLRWRIRQDATGGRTVTLGNKFTLPASVTSLEFSTAANKMDILAATYHASRDKWDVVALVVGY